jgi:hypothetical protein
MEKEKLKASSKKLAMAFFGSMMQIEANRVNLSVARSNATPKQNKYQDSFFRAAQQ